MKTQIKAYDAMISTWQTVATLNFMPSDFFAEKTVEEWAINTVSEADAIRIMKGNKILKEIEF